MGKLLLQDDQNKRNTTPHNRKTIGISIIEWRASLQIYFFDSWRFATKFHDKFSRSWINSTGQLFEWNRNGAIRSRFVSPIIKRRVKVGKFTKFCRPWKMNPSPEGITNGRHIYRREICQRRSFRQFWLILRDCASRVSQYEIGCQ